MKLDEFKQKVRDHLKYFNENKAALKSMTRNPQHSTRPVDKNVQHSERARVAGNELYEQAGSDPELEYKILYLYNESIAFAPPKSTALATAYGNKSALLRRMLKFKHSITEADKALAITQSISLKIKLLCRKAECFTGLRSSENQKCIEKAQFLLKKLDDNDQAKRMLNKLINKAQLFIDDPNSEYDKAERIYDTMDNKTLKIVAEAEKTTSIENSFKMGYSKRYGHHLVAARDFEPGEIMCVEKPYHTEVVDSKTPSYCLRCASFLWTIVPCDHCSWFVYCSEQCKTEDWNEHHDIGCGALQHMKKLLPVELFGDLAPGAFFFKALKEAGSISRLRAEVESMDKCEDHSNKNLTSDGKFRSYKTLCLVPTRQFPKKDLDFCIKSSCFGLIGLVKPILKIAYDPLDLKKLMKDETAVFMGAFLYKLQIINISRTKSAEVFDPAPNGSPHSPVLSSVVLTSRFTPISCVPNVGHCTTSNDKFFMYAIEPIKVGDQLFSSLGSSSIYCEASYNERQLTHTKYYQEPCKCQACKCKWDEILYDQTKDPCISDAKAAIFEELIAEFSSIQNEVATNRLYKYKIVDSLLMTRIRKLVAGAWKHFPMPSQFTLSVVKFMIDILEASFPMNSRITHIIGSLDD